MTCEEWNARERIEETNVSQPGMVQLELPDNPSPEISQRLKAAKREYDKARKAKQRKKESDKRLIEVIAQETGFFGFHHTSRILLYPDANIWLAPTDVRSDYKEVFRLLFNGYAPDFWQILFLMVVRISREAPSASFPLITFFKRSYQRTVYFDGEPMGEMEFPKQPDGTGRI